MNRPGVSRSDFTDPESLTELYKHFPSLADGSIERKHIQDALKILGFSLAGYQLRDLLAEIPASLERIPTDMFIGIQSKAKQYSVNGTKIASTKASPVTNTSQVISILFCG